MSNVVKLRKLEIPGFIRITDDKFLRVEAVTGRQLKAAIKAEEEKVGTYLRDLKRLHREFKNRCGKPDDLVMPVLDRRAKTA